MQYDFPGLHPGLESFRPFRAIEYFLPGPPKAMAERNGTISDGSPRAAHTRVPQGTADPDKNCHATGGATDPFRMTLEWFRLGVNSLY